MFVSGLHVVRKFNFLSTLLLICSSHQEESLKEMVRPWANRPSSAKTKEGECGEGRLHPGRRSKQREGPSCRVRAVPSPLVRVSGDLQSS